MTQRPMEKIRFVVALGLALGSAAWFGLVPSVGHRKMPIEVQPVVEDFPLSRELTARRPVHWPAPVAQPRGERWVYEVFTPPEIFYDGRTRRFSVTPPQSAAEPTARPAPEFDLELLAVAPVPFRLQLVGYVGEEGNYRGAFENVKTSEVFLAREGRRVPELGLEIVEFYVGRGPAADLEMPGLVARVARALVKDLHTGELITLNDRERRHTQEARAWIKGLPGEPEELLLAEGEILQRGEDTYKFEKIRLAPPTAEVIKESAATNQPQRLTLVPPEAPPM